MSTVWVPDELKQRIEFYAKIHGKPLWRVVEDAMVFYEMFHKGALIDRKTHNLNVPQAAKAVWYMVKLGIGVGALKAELTPQRAELLQKTIKQVRERLNIDVALLERALYDYIQKKLSHDMNEEEKRDAEIELTNALKLVYLDIIYSLFTRHEG